MKLKSKKMLVGIIVASIMAISLSGCSDYNVDNELVSETTKVQETQGTAVSSTEIATTEQVTTEAPTTQPIYTGISSTELVSNIRAGWNLGNALECCVGKAYNEFNVSGNDKVAQIETSWGSPRTTKAVISAVKSAGFNAVRVPVTYRNFINSNGIIDYAWLARIKEIVDWVIEEDMYCIINIHHDTGAGAWLQAEEANFEANKELVAKLWTQIADFFEEYDEHLVFEGFNELISEEKTWDWANEDEYAAVNKYNQLFVDTVRNTNGFNKYRCLIVNTYAAKANDQALSLFVVPTDTVDNRLIVSAHVYDGAESFHACMDRMNEYFVSQGVPCIIGEMGQQASAGNRTGYAYDVISYANSYGIKCFWWDDVGVASDASGVYNYALMNRRTGEWYFPDMIQSIMDATAN